LAKRFRFEKRTFFSDVVGRCEPFVKRRQIQKAS